MSEKYLTANQAITYLVGLDSFFLKTEYDPLDIIYQLYDEAEQKLMDAETEQDLETAQLLVSACQQRYEFALHIEEHFKNELQGEQSSLKRRSAGKDNELEVELKSFSNWAADNYAIEVPLPVVKRKSSTSYSWKDVEIIIYKNYRLRIQIGRERPKNSNFRDIGLMGRRRNEPNKPGMIFLGLSRKNKYPPNSKPSQDQKKAMTELRNALKKLAGINDDPFYDFNPGDGWRPQFKLTNHERCGDDRAKNQARHENIDDLTNKLYNKEDQTDSYSFDDDDDATGEWLKQNDPSNR